MAKFGYCWTIYHCFIKPATLLALEASITAANVAIISAYSEAGHGRPDFRTMHAKVGYNQCKGKHLSTAQPDDNSRNIASSDRVGKGVLNVYSQTKEEIDRNTGEKVRWSKRKYINFKSRVKSLVMKFK
uniref:Uncharacterized protein n=1 Tax=Bionectria ochroleuca TaxID=29856 RepID=A0A8H7NHD6_BIOOC